MQFSNGVSANTHKGFALEILMTMVHILDDGVLSLPFRLETAIRTGGHPQTRDLWREINHLEGSTHKGRRRKTPSEG
jgi:hypothetical protein